ncbi:MAG TPA: NAD(P)-dependent oxidoreductase, partial [Chthoniobacteraceae bacterium]|nr:NAD(P)-dependent oxidoreductase [Chthoniobacteraceae bacterium]
MKILLTGASGFIGTNAVEILTAAGDTVLNVDSQPPLNPAQSPFWKKADVLDAGALAAAFAEFSPEAVIHLAARTDCDESTTV